MDEISHFVRKGLKPENIVVITPDESFCEFLRLFDKDNMLNFASGISIKESLFYQNFKHFMKVLVVLLLFIKIKRIILKIRR